jgi:hypothetical protein
MENRVGLRSQSYVFVNYNYNAGADMHFSHRSIKTRASMFAPVLQIFFWGKNTSRSADLPLRYLDKVIYFKGTIFQGSTKPVTSQNRVEIS